MDETELKYFGKEIKQKIMKCPNCNGLIVLYKDRDLDRPYECDLCEGHGVIIIGVFKKNG